MSIAHEEAVLDTAAVDALFTQARTANTFTGEVTEEQAQAIYELAKFGPTAFNNQPLRVTYVRTPEARERLVKHMSRGNQAKTLSAPLVAVLSFDTEWHEQVDTFLPVAAEYIKGAYSADDSLRYGTGRDNAHLQAGYFILAVRALGLAAGPMTGADFSAIDAEFFPQGGRKSFLVVNIGQPGEDAWGPAKTKFAYEDVVETV
ncbi:putative NADH dehydrogenase/NAD(P)H nitroreductase [Sinomonas cellulolyticus]|uniref:Malonic semialdehyde reductase n=1 Tax=Sinomonas cellulolyticus TaxID=2801916 RepID=A0ABS1K929_9MICC|nr:MULTISPECIES: malonic semialdehyde reductase [Sinomonas]MBL0706826.1 malonic semialdehyde reductase [Sinomonas cellulolyticus]GHG52625.1 putative NADH dehydrogenase/NAD(P)H nitroreductase [Sinomonas sp. KCTC 49339]